MSIGRYRELEVIGRGEGSCVYRAVDPVNGEIVALKTLRTGLNPESTDARNWGQQFERNIEAAKRLGHPNIAAVLDHGDHEGDYYIVSEFVEGRSLTELLQAGGLGTQQMVSLAMQCLEGIDAAHAQGVVHHDLKPNNVMVTADFSPKITDFGLARSFLQMNEASPMPDAVRAHYRAPEQIYGKKSDERTDIFAIGILLYEMLVERKPFDGENWIQVTQKILNIDPPHLKDSDTRLPQALTRILSRALAKAPLDRYQTAREFHSELQAVCLDNPDPTTVSGERSVTGSGDGADDSKSAYIVVQDGEQRKIIPLHVDEFTVGRRGDNDLALLEEHISRAHAMIVRKDGRYLLVDRESRHGTYLNGRRYDRVVLSDGDRLEFGKGGRHRVTFHVGDIAPEARSASSSPTPLAPRDVELLLDVTRALNSSLELDNVLHIIMDSALTFTGADRGYIMLQDAKGQYSTRMMRHLDSSAPVDDDDSVSTTVVERCLKTRQPVVIHNIDEFSDLNERDSIVALKLKSIVAVPLEFRTSVLGVLYLDSRHLKAPLQDGQIDLLMAFAANAAIAIENARLYEMAIVDQKTGVYLCHHFLTRLSAEFQRAERYRSPLSLLFIDIDNFKPINDNFGHEEAGDPALRSVAKAIQTAARNTDIAARYGGDEFVLLAPETSIEMASVLAERLRSTIAESEQRTADNEPFHVTITVGVAAYPHPKIASAEDLLKMADAALLEAKKSGKNRVLVAPSGT